MSFSAFVVRALIVIVSAFVAIIIVAALVFIVAPQLVRSLLGA